jgi:hypothetical protein
MSSDFTLWQFEAVVYDTRKYWKFLLDFEPTNFKAKKKSPFEREAIFWIVMILLVLVYWILRLEQDDLLEETDYVTRNTD